MMENNFVEEIQNFPEQDTFNNEDMSVIIPEEGENDGFSNENN